MVVTDVLDDQRCGEAREAMYGVREAILAEVGDERLAAADELGVLRLMMRFDPFFLRFLEIPEVLAVVDATVGDAAILHVQNGLILPSSGSSDVFQYRFHQDFPRVLNGYLMSINTFFALDEFSDETGGTILVPGSHQRPVRPSEESLKEEGRSTVCPPGSMIVFDSTLWHAAGENTSGGDRLAINHQFTRSYVKQQIDYIRALGDEFVLEQTPRTQQLLGWYTRVVTSLDEYYRPAEERLYRSGQG
jgi:ectoine hydroxylase-related dioxygenase (phytanoyl-CoA dioxygenase family)